MVNMSLLTDLFDNDDIGIMKLNKKYIFFIIVIILLIIVLLFIKKEIYYQNTFNYTNNEAILLVEREYVNRIKEMKEIEVSGIMCGYSINDITSLDNAFLINIKLNTKINNISNGVYRIYLGKERLFDYIIRIIKK